MASTSIQQAIAQVREVRQQLVDRRRFKGYSGRARALCGTLALLTAAILGSPWYAHDPISQCDGWGSLVFVSMLINYGALIRWFFSDPETKRDLSRIAPAFDVFPPFLVGCALTVAVTINFDFKYLFGIWMCSYGLVNLSQRQLFHSSIRLLGLYYIFSGVLCTLVFHVPFSNPWPMGIVFFVGEMWGGYIFHINQKETANIFDFLIPSKTRS